MKICPGCKTTKTREEYRTDRSKKDGLSRQCKSCLSVYDKAAYRNTHKDTVAARSKRLYDTNKQIINEAKQGGCRICQENDIACLDLHHVDDTKEFALSSGARRSRSLIIAEIAKCVVLCANCHRKLHAGRITLEGAGVGSPN